MKNQPEKIYLQIDADGETPDDFKGLEVTWSEHQINKNDLVYVNADKIKEKDQRIKELEEEIDKMNTQHP